MLLAVLENFHVRIDEDFNFLRVDFFAVADLKEIIDAVNNLINLKLIVLPSAQLSSRFPCTDPS